MTHPASQPAQSVDAISAALSRMLARHFGRAVDVTDVNLLTGGAASQTFSFDTRIGDAPPAGMILRRSRPAQPSEGSTDAVIDLKFGPDRAGEFAVLQAAVEAGVPAPRGVVALRPEDDLGDGFVMERVAGETVARRILRDAEYAEARRLMARQCGEILGRIHTLNVAERVPLRHISTREHIDIYRQRLALWPEPMPVLEFGLRWIARRCPPEASEPVSFVHGDFRNGNLIVGPEGIRAVLDWELAHLGDPYEDLGWICTRAWRFGGPGAVGGFGSREDLFAGYETVTGHKVDRTRAHFWEVFGSLRWAIMCLGLASRHLSGQVRSMELAAIGRRVSENEHDLLEMIAREP
jgi:aminoglycoside phosphotransferase (APT) family kinase protein